MDTDGKTEAFHDVLKTTRIVATGVGVAIALGTIGFEYSRQIGRIERLEDQVRVSEAKVNASTSEIVDLKSRLRDLESKAVSTALQLAELSKKPTAVDNPIQRKCVELAEQVRTESASNGMGADFGPDVARKATATMKELGCASMQR